MPARRLLRLGVVGCGRAFERYHLPALAASPDWELAAASDASAERRRWLLGVLPEVSLFDSLEDLLAASRVDAVLIATPPATHCELAVLGLQRGAHVLVEKPMALNPSEGAAMAAAARHAGRRLWVGFNRRFWRPYAVLRERLSTVPANDIEAVHFELVSSPLRWKSLTPFLGDAAQGGGVLDDVASHVLDLLPWLTDQGVQAVRAIPLPPDRPGSVRVHCRLRFDSGAVASGEVGHDVRSAELVLVRLRGRSLAAGPYGVVESRWMPRAWARSYHRLHARASAIAHRLAGRPLVAAASFERQLGAFAAVIRGEGSAVVGADATSGLRVLQAIHACRESLQSDGAWSAPGSPATGIRS
jgi:predicted dehydrogenase